MTRAIIATTSVQKRKSDSQVMYIGIPSSPEEGKKILTSPKLRKQPHRYGTPTGIKPQLL
jgi:hypothetical protein